MRDFIKNIMIFLLLFLGMSLFSLIPAELFHIDLTKLSDSMKIMYELSCDIGYMIIVYRLYYNDINKDFKDFKSKFKDYFKISFRYYIVGYLVMILSNILISIFFRGAIAGNEEMVRSMIDKYPLYMLFQVTIYAPFIEEILFRKCIYDIVYSFKERKYTKYVYIITSGLIFALLHVFGSATDIVDYLYVIPYLGVGIAFAALYHKTNNIFTTSMMHMIHNSSAIFVYLRG